MPDASVASAQFAAALGVTHKSQMHLLGAALVDRELMNEKGHINNRAHTVRAEYGVWVRKSIHTYYSTSKKFNIFAGEDSSVRTCWNFYSSRCKEEKEFHWIRDSFPPRTYFHVLFLQPALSCLAFIALPANKNTTRRGNRAGRFRMTHFRVLEGEGARNFPAPVFSSLLTK